MSRSWGHIPSPAVVALALNPPTGGQAEPWEVPVLHPLCLPGMWQLGQLVEGWSFVRSAVSEERIWFVGGIINIFYGWLFANIKINTVYYSVTI